MKEIAELEAQKGSPTVLIGATAKVTPEVDAA